MKEVIIPLVKAKNSNLYDLDYENMKDLIRCKDCALFDPNWKCGFWHRFTIPEGFCHNYKEKEEEENEESGVD